MPALKDLVCHVQWADTGSSFPEYGTVYGDGLVETYIAVPAHPRVFTIRLTSRKFIYEGLSMVVFIDGQYQCNRNRVNLQPETKDLPENRSKVDFLLRQKEKPLGDGAYMGREWRFDDCNLVSQMPEKAEKTHFYYLGTIEVLVMRCRGRHNHERALSASSSGEHSALLDEEEGSDNTDSVGEADGADKKSGLEKQSTNAATAVPDATLEEAMPDFFGLFDGPADESPARHFSGDAPADSPYYYWQQRNRHSARYGPQEGSHRYPSYRAYHTPYEEARPTRYSYHDSSPPDLYARPDSPAPRSERHVHFDHGDGRGPRYGEYSNRYEPRHHPVFERNDGRKYTRTRPRSYHDAGRIGEHNPYPDYFATHERGPLPYASAHHEPQQAYSSYYHRAPPPSHREPHVYDHTPSRPAPHAYAHPPFAVPHLTVPPHQTPLHGQHIYGPPPLATSHGPNSAAVSSSDQPIPLPKIPMQHACVPQVQPHPVPCVVPPSLPPNAFVPSVPGSFAVYPSPGNQPLSHTQGPHVNGGHAQTTAPNGVRGPPDNTCDHQQEGNPSHKSENKTSGRVRYDNISDQYPPEKNGHNDSWGDSGDNLGDWANTAGNTNPNGTDNPGASNDNNDLHTDWAKDNDTSNNNTSEVNGEGWSNNNSDVWGNSDNNNDVGDSHNQAWDNRDSSNQQGSNDNHWANDTRNNQNSGPDNGWDNSQNNNPILQNQANSWDNGWNSNRTLGDQARNPSEGHNNRSASNAQPAPGNFQATNRVLYGPYGPYYGAKTLAQQGPPPDAEEEPRYDLPETIAQSRGVTKQVQPGPGYLYVKKRCAPLYVDSLDEPYAKFVFKYRTREQLRNEIGVDIVGEPTGDEEVNALENLDKTELIQLLLRAKGALGGTIPEPPPKPTPSAMNGFEQISVAAPDVSFLHYSLPPLRHVSNSVGLGIRHPSSNRGNGGTPGQNNNANGGMSRGQENRQKDRNVWSNDNNNNAANNSGWDGAQERKPCTAPEPPTTFGAQLQNPVQHGDNPHPNGPSRHSSGISPKNMHGVPPGPTLNDYNRLFPGAGAARGEPIMSGPPPPPPIINFAAEGTVGGGQTHLADALMGAGPRPPTPTVPPRPPTPINENEGAAWGEGGDATAAQPQSGW
ncbi:hypothetical protein A1O7_10165 [Cladophialophora yegresii CBS 114405]|uniref:Uncharacterized protein n=1 Tax=Cladophialophora yegresii CBS 114405 TaxID=1182544 RepID=W9W8E8_9EURO|nr:uncharacterized protein A1O7_10165 [Cladophialophora yegresii CBS 114405]EXJ54824.1 hypothetical protein A1O7_10165 [Cladophialophora yegresii CBS 114405]